jgi:hypothetical protein
MVLFPFREWASELNVEGGMWKHHSAAVDVMRIVAVVAVVAAAVAVA